MTDHDQDHDSDSAIETTPLPVRHARPLNWFVEALRVAVFMPPRWSSLRTSPAVMAALFIMSVLVVIGVQRLMIDGPATFYWQAITADWIGTLLVAWACYLMRPLSDDPAAARTTPSAIPRATLLFTMTLAQAQVLSLLFGLLLAVLVRSGKYTVDVLGPQGMWIVYLLPMAWVLASQLVLFFRIGGRARPVMAFIVPVMLLASAMPFLVPSSGFWNPVEPVQADSGDTTLRLNQEAMEQQPRLLAQRLNDIKPQRPGVLDLYVLTFAPYANENVFRRESELVASVMAQRFDAAGRTLQLVNNAQTTQQWPWATPLNLQRAIHRFAAMMDREDDILFLHLTSHGARDGELAAEFRPMEVDPLRPGDLKRWLDQAGIRNRVISISACFSGSWIATLADENTLVMTASDADHTSYGCGRKSELTFFGRAMYDEQLRSKTLSFETAHAAARVVIKQREEAAGKSDGYSNPQIVVGAGIRARLARLEARIQALEGAGVRRAE
ncbi:MAG: hypothetical protein H7315_11365 [Herminiimonas sp.]|nr:hypothetical protein [Herminiimonas sp.]